MLDPAFSTTPEAFSIVIIGTANYGAGGATKCSVSSLTDPMYQAPDDGIARVLHWDVQRWRTVPGGPAGSSLLYRVPPRRVMTVLRQNTEIPLVGLRGDISLEPFDKVSRSVESFSEANGLAPDPVAASYEVPDLQVVISLEHPMGQAGTLFHGLTDSSAPFDTFVIPPGARRIITGGHIFTDSGWNIGALDFESMVPGSANSILLPGRATYLRRNALVTCEWSALMT